jgi:hypothetical protein
MVNKLPNEIIDKILIQLGNLDIANGLKRYYVYRKIYKFNKISDWYIDYASEHGHLEILKYYCKDTDMISIGSINAAIMNGQLNVIKYFHSIKSLCNYDEETDETGEEEDFINTALINKKYKIAEYLYSMGISARSWKYGNNDVAEMINDMLEYHISLC